MTAEPRAFVDTNVLVYAFDKDDDRKRRIARELIARLASDSRLYLSTQVLSEFFVTVTRKIKPPMPAREAIVLLGDLSVFPVLIADSRTVMEAAELSDASRISLWDALLVVSARNGGAKVLYTEDLSHGQTILDVAIVNPFLP